MNYRVATKSEIFGLVEDHIFDLLKETEYCIQSVHPGKLLTINRLDIILCFLYLRICSSNQQYADKLYSADISAHTFGRMYDHDNVRKKTLADFTSSFHLLLKSLERYGYNPNIGLIPLANDGSLLNGGHRLSAALHLGLSVATVRTKVPPLQCDYKFLLNRGVPRYMVEHCVQEYIRHAPGYCITISTLDFRCGLPAKSNLILYSKELVINERFLHNISRLYESDKIKHPISAAIPRLPKYLLKCFANRKKRLLFTVWKNSLPCQSQSPPTLLAQTSTFTASTQYDVQHLIGIFCNPVAITVLSRECDATMNSILEHIGSSDGGNKSKKIVALSLNKRSHVTQAESQYKSTTHELDGIRYLFAAREEQFSSAMQDTILKYIHQSYDPSVSFQVHGTTFVVDESFKDITTNGKKPAWHISRDNYLNASIWIKQKAFLIKFLVRRRLRILFSNVSRFLGTG